MKNALKLSALLATLSISSAYADEAPTTAQLCDTACHCMSTEVYEALSRIGCINIEIDAAGFVHALMPVEAFGDKNINAAVGSMIGTIGRDIAYIIESIELSEDHAYFKVVLSVVELEQQA